MRMLQVINEKDPNKLMDHVNNYFEKLERLGYQVIKTDYAIGVAGTWSAFIDYEKKVITK